MQALSTTAADAVEQVFTLVLQNKQHNALQDAMTFSRLLCVNQQLRQALLASAVGRITLCLPSHAACSSRRSMILWLQQHLRLHTLKQVQLLQDLLDRPIDDVHQVLTDAVLLLDSSHPALCSRVAGVLADAAAGSNARLNKLPVLTGWYGHDLPAATVSMLPGNHLTQLVLTSTNYDPGTVEELSALTNLQELRLPGLCPPPARLAPALSALSSLTRLLLVETCTEVMQALPVSLQELVLVRGVVCADFLPADFLPDVSLGHMTNLKKLHVFGADTLDEDVFGHVEGIASEAFSGRLFSGDVVPDSLKWLSLQGIRSWDSLRPLKQLTHVRIVWAYPSIWPGAIEGLTSLSTLTRVEVLQQGEEAAEWRHIVDWSRLCSKLPLYVASLNIEVPTDRNGGGLGAAGGPVGCSVLGAFTSLTRLVLSRRRARRAAAILTAAAAAGGNGVGTGAWLGGAQELAGALVKLTNLSELQLKEVPAVTGGGAAAVGLDWLPVMQAIASLPSLHQLRVESMPLGPSVSALSASQNLTSLSLENCQVEDGGMLGMVTGMQCCLQELTIEVWARFGEVGPMLSDDVLVALVQQLSHLTRLCLTGQVFAPGAVTDLSRLQQLRQITLDTGVHVVL